MRLACLLGRHSWTTQADHGDVCSICGQEKKKGGGSGDSSAIHHADEAGPAGLPRRSPR